MRTLNSSVLIVHHPHPEHIDFGADIVNDIVSAAEAIQTHNYQVVVIALGKDRKEDLLNFFEKLHQQRPHIQKIYINLSSDLSTLLSCLSSGQSHKILSSYEEPEFSQSIQEALSEYALSQQNSALLSLVRDQYEQLKRLSVRLEGRVKKRESYLRAARERLVSSSQRIEVLHRALIAVHRAESVTDMEGLIQEALSSVVKVQWTRILFANQSYLEHSDAITPTDYSVLSIPLLKNHERIGHIYFARSNLEPFDQNEEQFLLQISNAVALAIDRLNQMDNAENIKRQWDGTFDAISSPVSLVDSQYRILRANQALTNKANLSELEIVGQTCYQALFDRAEPCEGCLLGENFRITNLVGADDRSVETVDVRSQILPYSPLENRQYVNFYKDVSSQLRMERQIIHSAKMAELGTIGSSIAHEINNPLAGLLSFIQLIKMDLTGKEDFYEDIIEMESGARRCKSIVQNLLNFSRQTNLDEQVQIDLREIVEQSIRITEIQTRSKGIMIHTQLEKQPIWVRGNATQLTQALRNLLQNANEGINARLRDEPEIVGRIELDSEINGKSVLLTISDNGQGIHHSIIRRIFNPNFTTKDPNLNPGVGLTTARQIIAEHGGSLEIISEPRQRTRAIISLPVLKALD